MAYENDARISSALLVLFAISGFAGLIYESIWTQYLGLFLGHAAYAQSFVLVLFMGGMAAGAWLVSRKSDRIARPLAVYAAVELFIGVLGVAFDPLYRGATEFAYASVFPLLGEGIGLDTSRYAIATALIGTQCVALGATFPLVSTAYLRHAPANGGRVLAGLYFSNSFGAALGALIATFVLLPSVGLPGTVMAGGLLSILVALAAWPLSKRTSSSVVAARQMNTGTLAPVFLLAAAAVTGATSFVYEVTWIRMLALAVGSTLHAFELMLAAFISGIACGGWWLHRRADTWNDVIGGAGWAQVFMGIAALGSLFVYAHSFEWVAYLLNGLNRTDTGYIFYNVATGVLSLAVMFPAAFFAGMTLPLLTLALLRQGAGESAIGRTYAANTLGAIVGVLLTVHLLMPYLGVRMSLWLAALGDLGLGVYLLVRSSRVAWRRALVASGFSALAAVCAFAFTRVDPLVLASSVFRSGRAMLASDTKMLFYGDGKTASVALFETPDQGNARSIATNGKVDAGISTAADAKPLPDEYTMTLAAALPLAAVEKPSNVAVIGFGSGITVHTFLGSDRVERLDVIEIEPFMVEAAKSFGSRVSRAYEDKRVNIVIDDAKAYLSGTARKYDAIVSEPSNPWVSGVGALFSEEFYDFVPKHLGDDGVFLQWLQLYEITPDLVGSVLKAMLPRFADVQAYISNEGDMLLLASPKRKLPALGELATLDPKLGDELRRLGVRKTADLKTFSLTGKDGLVALASMSGYAANSDLFPILQLQAPKARYMRTNSVQLAELMRSPWPLLEAVGEYRPAPVSEDINTVMTRVYRDVPERAARIYRNALLSDAPVAGPFVDNNVAYRIEVMRGLGKSCHVDASASEWIEASVAVARTTIPYLTATDLEHVWIDPVWMSACVAKEERVVQSLRLYAALSARDWSHVIEAGSNLLSSDAAMRSNEFKSYVLGATELAYLAQGQPQSLVEIESKYGAGASFYLFERMWMYAHAMRPVDRPLATR